MIASWPFESWGKDIIRLIDPPSTRAHRFILAVTDYFLKWAEVISLCNLCSGSFTFSFFLMYLYLLLKVRSFLPLGLDPLVVEYALHGTTLAFDSGISCGVRPSWHHPNSHSLVVEYALRGTILVVRSSVKETFTPTELHRWIEGFPFPDPPCEISSKFVGWIARITPEKPHSLGFSREDNPADFVVASSSSTAREVLKTHDHVLASRPTLLAIEKICYNSSGIGFSPYGPYWRQLRKICTQELLSTKKVKSLSFIRYEEAQNILYKIKRIAGSPMNLTEMFQEVTNSQITRTAFGKECTSRHRFILAMKETIKLLPMLKAADLFPYFSSLISFLDGSSFQMKRLRREMDYVLDEIIMEHKEKKVVTHEMEEDLIDVLLRIQEKGELQVPLTTDNVKAVILDLLVAAIETTSNTLCWIMSELICHPEVMCKAQKEIREALGAKIKIEDNDIHELHYLHNVIKETLRLHPPLPLLLPRTCNEPTELCGFMIPKKARVVVNVWAIARDPKFWVNPDNFYPERFDDSTHDFRGTKYEYLPFGSGRRICPGATFAMAEIELFISLLLLHFDWEIPGGKSPTELDMEEELDGTARKKKDLYLIATTHSI
ncbi:hypothetical protein KFK09_000555 [Dendrobium nobile]|uniref:Cytochrome P450 n=1 Tax=Dendrobium nobile TaxID=94219 RepID=A0A8T3CBF8_DENNO|nr:hypothetical protein KFK09_000555 [Dendrobium nobile]